MAEAEATGSTQSGPKITLIWLNESRAQRIVWLLEELGLEYEVKAYKRRENKQAPAELKEFHPLGKAPVLIIDGQTLAESGFIVEYLVDRFGPRLKPPTDDAENYLQYKHLLHYAEGSLQPYLLLALVASMIKGAPVPFFIKPITSRIADQLSKPFITPNLVSNFDYLESLLKGKLFFVDNELSGADILLSFPVESAAGRVGSWFNKEKYPNLFAWMDRIKERPAYRQAYDKVAKIEANL
ncbi:hypothetical protein TWF225_005630 [Orbilia oligospora]|uniref:glutathione transferase n=1 Tax=Orbilia oligospora TaxID=2813651 RepID=A0A7C8K688_ORBOL|nr:hypothetical protein TWF751_009520 [Orbilia oligospora]KAF3185143.1 hypothetical protein TWF225_005630 [Orbilia oligospora]KAF3236615.1 hypothetical protein TWF128_001342 [Orbilia oligospora]KAF3253801.1 hypothetical protein TWF217_007277 [Orbilia oligospora]KAF3294014.1 hypothetical protein TWF132_003893 [Orbilia oligospora]